MHRFTGQILATVLLATGAITANAQEIKIGSVIYLQNKFSAGGRDHFLDTQGRVKDNHKDKQQHNLFVLTNSSKDRDKGSGSWKVISHSKKEGEPLAYGDRISLQNMHPNAGYLDEGDDMWADEYGPLFKRRGREINDYPVFTANVAKDNSETWIVGGRPNVKSGAVVKAGEWITLEAASHPGHFLRAGFLAQELPKFKSYGARNLVYTSNSHFGQGENLWIPILK
ncbi:MAG: hypothetical protein R2762_20670 [Bryobacteraceae bacterium]